MLAVLAAACNAPIPPDAHLSLDIRPTSVSVPLGGEQSAAVTVVRFGDFSGDVTFTVEGAPPGVTATVTSVSTTGQTTIATVLLRADAGAKVGTFPMTVRGRANLLVDATSLLLLSITEPASYTLSVSKAALTIARGGIAQLTANIARTNFPAPVTLSLEGAAGITADFAANPSASDAVPVTISVAPTVAPGTYTLSVHAVAAGLTDRIAPVAITVVADPLQLIPLSNASGYQASTVTASLIVNRGTITGAVALAMEGLPSGVTATAQAVGATSGATMIALAIGASTAPGTYALTVRATGAGAPDATTPITLTVLPTVFGLSVSPQSVSLLQGTSASASLAVTRTAIDRPVVITTEGAPAGISISASPASVAGTSAALSLSANAAAVPGQYDIVVRGTPEGLTAAASVATTLNVIVRATAAGSGNVVLDWSSCAQPGWVAAQDGSGAWAQQTGTSGVFRFNVTSGTGGYAFADGNTVTVRYMTQAELTAGPIDMCAGAPGTKTVNGSGAHAGITEQWVYRLGGGNGASTGAGPSFAITGVREGVHDLVVWGTASPGLIRGLIRRDLNIPDGGSVGSINLAGPEAFPATQRALGVAGGVLGEQFVFTVSYLTTAACTVNLLSTTAVGTTFMYGVPDSVQRPNDFHMVTASANAPTSVRSVTEVFHTFAARTLTVPPAIAVPTITTPNGAYRRLQAAIGTITSSYNGSSVLRYTDGVRTFIVGATVGYTGTTSAVVAMPDLSGVSGWPTASAIPPDAHGTWTVTLDGTSASVPLCTEGRRSIAASRSGTY